MQAKTTKKAFKQTCSISSEINSAPETIWKLLTGGEHYTKWNSTIISLEGNIVQGGQIKLKCTLDPKRIFRLNVTKLQPHSMMVWEDGFAPIFKGVRTYELVKVRKNVTKFTMTEVFKGIMLPMIAGSLPDFGPSFEQFTKDLKQAAEQH